MNDKTTEIVATEERARTRAMQQRQQQAAAMKNTQSWCTWIDQRVTQHYEQRVRRLENELAGDEGGLHEAIGRVISEEREAPAQGDQSRHRRTAAGVRGVTII